MEHFEDQGIILGIRPHGENGAVVALLTQEQGRHAGYVYGGMSHKKRGQLEPGTHVQVDWRARTHDQLGTYTLEPITHYAARALDDPARLAAVLSACALCESALPEREGHPGLFYGLLAMLEALTTDHWAAVYVAWELALLRELGFALDLSKCAQGGDSSTLSYVSPKTGRAVSAAAGAPYADRLLKLPEFLKPAPQGLDAGSPADIVCGLALTGYFLTHWVYAHHTRGVPEARAQLVARLTRALENPQSPE